MENSLPSKNTSWPFRLLQVLAALIPFSIGFTSLLNNVTYYQDSLKNIVAPLISMSGVEATQRWRAIAIDPHVCSFMIFPLLFINTISPMPGKIILRCLKLKP